jgi:hypothetical protein
MAEVLVGHLREHLGSDSISARQRNEELDQVVSLLRSYLR